MIILAPVLSFTGDIQLYSTCELMKCFYFEELCIYQSVVSSSGALWCVFGALQGKTQPSVGFACQFISGL